MKARQNGNTKFRTVPFSSNIYLGFNRLCLETAKTCFAFQREATNMSIYSVTFWNESSYLFQLVLI